jgi:hypothetical protein
MPTFIFPWKPNAELQARPEAEAKRKLEGVACKLWFGWVSLVGC